MGFGIALAIFLSLAPDQVVHGQEGTVVECGQILDSEFTENVQEHIYLLGIAPRDSFEVSIQPAGDVLKTVIVIYGPSGLALGGSGEQSMMYSYWKDNTAYSIEKSPSFSTGILSATGTYKIRVANTWIMGENAEKRSDFRDEYSNILLPDRKYFDDIGLYTLSIGCIDHDGNSIEPGDTAQPTPTPAPLPTPAPRAAAPPDFTGIGFPDLAVDFSSVAQIPLILDTTITGVIPIGNEILGFNLDAQANDTLDLAYTHASGNMNLGLVVLSEINEVYFQSSLVTSESLSTRFTLPEAGQYTIGVFRISLVEPAEVEPTVFQLMGSLVGGESE